VKLYFAAYWIESLSIVWRNR